MVTIQGVHLYVALSSVTLLLRKRIKPFTTNKALQGLLPVMGPFYSRVLPRMFVMFRGGIHWL